MLNIPDGKCPSCGKVVHGVTIDNIPASIGIGQPEWRAVSFCCKTCKTVLGVSIDPVALKTDTVDEILRALKR